MTHDHHHVHKKKLTKKQLNEKNRFHRQLFELMRMRRADAVRVKENAKKLEPKKEEKKSKGEWSDKVSTVRNRLTGKKRESKERWNRFAGTSDGGGRGL